MKKVKLDELQFKVMKVLWQQVEATVVQIRTALNDEYAITTIGTILQRLHKKEAVDFHKNGRQYVYRALITEEDTKRSMVNNLVDKLFQGKSSVLVNHLIQASEFENNELEQLRHLIDEAIKNQDHDN